ncbi:MAG TPA: DUF1405 domain-containing protein [Symbiobacteriaceae bacterium]|nr:DUF1405 domain-containing protein [Symbiobacteriaceae bacterium]
MTFLRKFFASVATDRRWWWVLIGINFFGSLYGFYWYKGQLEATPAKYWLIVPDSPGSTFLLFIWLVLLLAGVDWRKPGMQWLGAIAFVSNMKYGLWTATVLPQAGFKFGWDFDFIHLSISHAGMWVQAMIFARFYKPGLAPAVGALLFMWFQDLIDYFVLNTHPTLPYESELAYARGMAILLSTLWGGFLVWQAWFDRNARKA